MAKKTTPPAAAAGRAPGFAESAPVTVTVAAGGAVQSGRVLHGAGATLVLPPDEAARLVARGAVGFTE